MHLSLMDVEDAIFKFRGLIPLAASYLGVEEHELFRYIKNDPHLEAAWKKSRGLLLQRAETVLEGLLSSQDPRIALKASEVIVKSIQGEDKAQLTQNIVLADKDKQTIIQNIFK